MYDHVIVPFDGSEAARRSSLLGADLSKLFDARLVVVTATAIDQKAGLHELKARAESMSDESVDVWVEPARRPAQALKTMLGFRPDSLICMSTHARAGMKRLTSGNRAEAVLDHIDAPVVLTGPEYEGGDPIDLRRLVVCVDGSDTAESIVALAASWADFFGIDATLLHVQDGEEEPDLDLLAKLLDGPDRSVEALSIDGPDVADRILDTIAFAANPIVVMASHRHDGLGKLMFRNRVVEVVRHSRVPVLVHRTGHRR
jgi:nucleotide-binding universal stress UspA family protein